MDKSEETPNLILKTRYNKSGTAGIEGSLYQINVLTMILLNGLKKVAHWRLSTEHKDAGKFDDLIFEFLPSEYAILLQAKHKKNEKKKVTYEDLVSVNTKNEFSLPKYFFSYLELRKRNKFKVQKIGICTNLSLDENAKKHLRRESLNSESILHFPETENIYYTSEGCSLPLLKQNIHTYYAENMRNKEILITDEAIEDFLAHLQIFPNFLGDEILDNVIEQTMSGMMLSVNMDNKAVFKDIHLKMMGWFTEETGRYLTQLEAKGFFCDIRSNKYCYDLKQLHDISFENNDLLLAFLDQVKKGKDGQEQIGKAPKRILHILPKKDYVLNVIKIYQALPSEHKTKTLFVNPNDSIDVQMQIINGFKVQHYTILVIVCDQTLEENAVTEICDTVEEILHNYKYKRVILVAEKGNNLARRIESTNVNCYETISDRIMFSHLDKETQQKLKGNKNINFQGSNLSLEELFKPSKIDELDHIVDSEIIAKLARGDFIQVGPELKQLDHYYIRRSFIRNGRVIPEENIWHPEAVSEEKVILIADLAGMGKSTVLTSLELSIKKDNPHLWVIRFDLNTYTDIMKSTLEQGRDLNITQLLNSFDLSKPQSEFEKKLFTTQERIILMLDGVDEVSPTYTQLIINLIDESVAQSNLAKMFVTLRPHLGQEFEELLKVKSFTLEPFSVENQTDFLTKYWTKELDLQDDDKKKKCEKYARALIRQVYRWINDTDRNSFAGIPLQTRMLAGVFQNQASSEELRNWQGCTEFVFLDDDKPKLPQRINLVQLYELFIDKKRAIFITEKCNTGGNIISDLAAGKEFEKCQEFHRALALNVFFYSDELKLFTSCTNIEWPIPSEFKNTSLLKAGIVHTQEEKLYFIHQTFAEYFVAESLMIELQCKPVNIAFQKFFIEDIMCYEQYSVIRIFFDNMVKKVVSNNTPLDEVACWGHLNVIKGILKEKTQKTAHRVFIETARAGHLNIIKFLVGVVGAKVLCRSSALPEAAYAGHLDVVEFLVQMAQRDENCKDIIDSAIRAAVEGGKLKIVEFLVKNAGLNVNAKDEYGRTILFRASQISNLEILKFLVNETDANVNSKTIEGSTALHWACANQDTAIIKFLVEAGADVNANDKDCRTPLHETLNFMGGYTSENRLIRLEIIKFLVKEADADVNATDKYGMTVLHNISTPSEDNSLFYSVDYLRTMQFLVNEVGADVNVKDKNGTTVLIMASAQSRLETVKFLVNKAGADVKAKDKNGRTALTVAFDNEDLLTMAFLVNYADADVNTMKKKGAIQRLLCSIRLCHK